ncbi:hypothetical protein [Mycolicibacter minnesotensis]
MTSALIMATLGMVVYCLWVRRDTWWSRWEVGATVAIALEGIALVLLTPWAGHELAPQLHSLVGIWNFQQLIGCLLLMAGVNANIYHMLVRLADPAQVPPIMRKHLAVPMTLGTAVLTVAAAKSNRGFQPDIFAALAGDRWMTVFEVTTTAMLLFLSAYIGRLLWSLRKDPRATTTLTLYLTALVLVMAACTIAGVSAMTGVYAGSTIWACCCLSVITFAYGLARSWQSKQAWFSPEKI